MILISGKSLAQLAVFSTEISIKLRPHHLLCTLGYEGKGYSEAFVANMDAVAARLRGEAGLQIEVVLSTDDLCDACPHRLGDDLCEMNDAVKAHDRRVCEALQLVAGRYAYADLLARMRRDLDADALCTICGDCAWLPLTACRALALGRLQSGEGDDGPG